MASVSCHTKILKMQSSILLMISGQKTTQDSPFERKWVQNNALYCREDHVQGGGNSPVQWVSDCSREFGFWHASLSVELLVLTDQSSTSSRHTKQYTEVIEIHVYRPIHTFTYLYVYMDTHTFTDIHAHTHTVTVYTRVPSSHKRCSAT